MLRVAPLRRVSRPLTRMASSSSKQDAATGSDSMSSGQLGVLSVLFGGVLFGASRVFKDDAPVQNSARGNNVKPIDASAHLSPTKDAERSQSHRERGSPVGKQDSRVGNNVVSTAAGNRPIEKLAYAEPIVAKYVLVGGGVASYAAYKAIREKDPDARVAIICAEQHPPYRRPPLSKELWQSPPSANPSESLVFTDWAGKPSHVEFAPAGAYDRDNVDLLLAAHVSVLDIQERAVRLRDGRSVLFEKLLLATGGTPINPVDTDQDASELVSTYRDISDFRRVFALQRQGKRIAVVGGGFLGSELVCALSEQNSAPGRVVSVFPEPGYMARFFPQSLSQHATETVRARGVDVYARKLVKRVTRGADGQAVLLLSDGSTIEADHVVVAAGIAPNTELAADAGLEIDSLRGGVLCNSELEARSGVYAAGDCSSYYDVVLGRRRVEHFDHAWNSGTIAGTNMASESKKPYSHQSFFWSDMGSNIGLEAVGRIDASLKTVSFFENFTSAPAKPDREKQVSDAAERDISVAPTADASLTMVTDEPPASASPAIRASSEADELRAFDPAADKQSTLRGVVYYIDGERVVGVLMWNVFDKVDAARSIILERKRVSSPADARALRTLIPIVADNTADDAADAVAAAASD